MHLAALFDMDGLLIDSERVIMAAWLEVARRFDVPLSEASYAAVVGRKAAESDVLLAGIFGGGSRLQAAQAEVNRALERQPLARRYPLKPGAARLLGTLAATGTPCVVASSSARFEIEERLFAAGILDCFVAVAGGDEVAAGKPDPAVYRLAAARAGVAPERCLAFEDSPNGARAALAAGASLVLVPDLVEPPEEIAARCLCVLRSLEEAMPSVGSWFGGRTRETIRPPTR